VSSVLDDIMSEAAVVRDTLAEGDRRLPGLVSRLKKFEFDRIYMFGAGSSNHVGLGGRYAVEQWARIATLPLSASDWGQYALAAANRCIAVAISQSGETIETLSAAQAARAKRMPLIALTNDEQSRIARECDEVILLRAGYEQGPGTKTVMAQCVAVYQFALYLALALGHGPQEAERGALAELGTAPDVIADMLSAKNQAGLEASVDELELEEVLYLVGAGPFWPLALQAANYLREVCKIHCCPFEATEFRHGPLEALGPGSKLLVLSNGQCQGREQVERACRGAAEAGARLIYMGDAEGRPEAAVSAEVLLPAVGELLAAQIYLAPIHLLGWQLARRKGLEPGRFDHIVKTWRE
jgi:glucosamine--fructose-6-phosphate aminotransferase (isomerizing)